mgnify:CR=1 FL=1
MSLRVFKYFREPQCLRFHYHPFPLCSSYQLNFLFLPYLKSQIYTWLPQIAQQRSNATTNLANVKSCMTLHVPSIVRHVCRINSRKHIAISACVYGVYAIFLIRIIRSKTVKRHCYVARNYILREINLRKKIQIVLQRYNISTCLLDEFGMLHVWVVLLVSLKYN